MPLLSKKSFAKPRAGLHKQTKAHSSKGFKTPLLIERNINEILGISNLSQATHSSDITSEFSTDEKKTTSEKTKLKRTKSNVSVTMHLSMENITSESIRADDSDISDLSYRMNEPAVKECYLQFVKKLSQSSREETMMSPPGDHKKTNVKNRKINDKSLESNDSLIQKKVSSKKSLPVKKTREIEERQPLKKGKEHLSITSNDYQIDASTDSGVSLSQEILNRTDVKAAYVKFMQPYLENDDILKNTSTKRKNNKKKRVISSSSEESIEVKKTKIDEKKIVRTEKLVKRSTKRKILSKNKTDEYSLQEKMALIHESRNVGLYALCDICNKARYLPHVKDPLDLPEKWYCAMNPDDKHNICSQPEEVAEDEDYLIENLYNAGSIVWAKMDGYPWWPAMVEDDPDTEQYFWLEGNSSSPTWYHVTFFDSNEVTRAWIRPSGLKPFKRNISNPNCQTPKTNKFHFRVLAAMTEALNATDLPLIDRLKTYSFITRYKKPIKARNNLKKQVEDEQKGTPKKRPSRIRMIGHEIASSRENSPTPLTDVEKNLSEQLDSFSDILKDVNWNETQNLDLSLLE